LAATAFVAVGLASNWNTYMSSEKGLLLLFAISTFAVGIVEELTLLNKSIHQAGIPLYQK
jgi:hypothetical protein